MERRRGAPSSSSPLPKDYLTMVTEVFTTNFDEGLNALANIMEGRPQFEATGQVYGDEVVLAVSLVEADAVAATTVYASIDFDPKASSPTVQDLLAACLDATGAIFGQILTTDNPERLEQIASRSLSAVDNVPFHWTEVRLDRYRVYLKVDKANPRLEALADDWLHKHDPGLKQLSAENEEEAKKLFVTGENAKKAGRGTSSGSLH